MAIIINNKTSLDRSYPVMINGKKVDVLMPHEELYVPLQEEPSQLKFPWVRHKPINVEHDDRLTLTDHPIGLKLRHPLVVGLFNASVILIPSWTRPSVEEFASYKAYVQYSICYQSGFTLCLMILFVTLLCYFPPFNIKKE